MNKVFNCYRDIDAKPLFTNLGFSPNERVYVPGPYGIYSATGYPNMTLMDGNVVNNSDKRYGMTLRHEMDSGSNAWYAFRFDNVNRTTAGVDAWKGINTSGFRPFELDIVSSSVSFNPNRFTLYVVAMYDLAVILRANHGVRTYGG